MIDLTSLLTYKQELWDFLTVHKKDLQKTVLVLSIISLYLRTFQQRKNWFVDTASRILNLVVYIQLSMYGCVLRTIALIGLNFYGNWKWKGHEDERKNLKISFMPARRFWLYQGTAAVLGLVVVGPLLSMLGGTVPYIDGMRTLVSIVMVWMLARKYVQGWGVWAMVSLVWMGVCWYRGAYWLIIKYALYFFSAIYSYYKWRSIAAKEENAAEA